jgi:hypothetical protein
MTGAMGAGGGGANYGGSAAYPSGMGGGQSIGTFNTMGSEGSQLIRNQNYPSAMVAGSAGGGYGNGGGGTGSVGSSGYGGGYNGAASSAYGGGAAGDAVYPSHRQEGTGTAYGADQRPLF